MPINATLGSTIEFTAVFFSSANVLTVPTSAAITITYGLSSNSLSLTSCSITMTLSGSTYSANWSSAVAALGLASYSIVAQGQAAPLTGTLRLTT